MSAVEMWIAGLLFGVCTLLLKWLNNKINRETERVLDELKQIGQDFRKEKEQTVWRVDEIYKRIDLHKTEFHELMKKSDTATYQNRKEVDNKMGTLMTEHQVKDFVDRSLRPIIDDVKSTKVAVEDVKEGNSQIHADVRVLNTMITKLIEDKSH